MASTVTPFPTQYENTDQEAPVDPLISPYEIAFKVGKQGAHPEYMSFQTQLGVQKTPLVGANAPGRSGRVRMNFNVWDLINDAVDGTGGFVDGSYLVPHELELVPNRSTGLSSKFLERMQLCRYDKFPKVICDGPWNSIVSMKNIITRDAGGSQRLMDFWDNVDGEGTDIVDFLEYPVSQARRFGTGWMFLDRVQGIRSLVDDLTAAPWAYTVPTRNVVWWEFNKGGGLEAVAYRDPQDEPSNDLSDLAPLKIWTKTTWSRWLPTKDAERPYEIDPGAFGPNLLGQVPCVLIHDEYPGCGKAFGKSNMLSTAIMGFDVFNRDSEIREIERMCAFPVLNVSIEDISEAQVIAIGADAVLASTGKWPSQYLEPTLNSIDKLQEERKQVKEAAYVNSEMAGLIGHSDIQRTTSGYHSEVELDKSERRIGKMAASVEAAENKIARLFKALIGEPDEGYSISYPSKFGFVDPDKLIARTQLRLGMNLGPSDMEETLTDYYSELYPRKTDGEIATLVQAALDAKAQATAAMQQQFASGTPGQPGAPGNGSAASVATARQRLGLTQPGGAAAPVGARAEAASWNV